jgi:penicillin-binding protein 1A
MDRTPNRIPARGSSSGSGQGDNAAGAASPASAPPQRRASARPLARAWVINPSRSWLVGWILRYAAFAVLVLGLGVVVAGTMLYRYFTADLPPLDAIERYESTAPGVTRIYSSEGAVLAELAREHRAYARYEDIPEPLVHAFLAAEDRRFFEHGGLDVRGLARAIVANLRSGTVVQGGSTITQQVAKTFLTHEQTIARKLREAILSVRVEARLSKEQILEIYLNKIFLGHGAYGVAAAASRYFDKPLSQLTLAECAMIAGLARAPSRYSPVVSLESAMRRRAVVLEDMVEAGYIDAAARDAAAAEPMRLAEHPDLFRARSPYYAEEARQRVVEALGEEALLTEGLQIETTLESQLQDMAARAVDKATRKLDQRQGFRGPVAHLSREAARTELDRRLTAEYGQKALSDPERWYLAVVTKINKYNAWVDLGAVDAIVSLRNMAWASKYDRNSGINDVKILDAREALEEGDVVWVRHAEQYRGKPADPETPDMLEASLGQAPRIEAALFTMEHDTGYVVSTQGGHDYDRSQFNRTVQACRQPGSVFKAIYYAYALDTGRYTMDSELEDKPYEPEPGEEWNPQNIHGTLEGKVLLRNAFIHSLNLPSIRLFLRLGADNVVEFARRLGFSTELIADKALSLGASCVQMDELTRAFAVFVQGGQSVPMRYLRRVVDKQGRVVLDQRHPIDEALDVGGRVDALVRHATDDAPIQVVDARTAFLITHMMVDVVTSGIARQVRRIGVEAGGKSGTASKNEYTTDTWFVGFTARHVTAAWMGDDQYERSLGDEDASYTTATPLFTDFMAEVVAGVPHAELPLRRPPGVRAKLVRFTTGAGDRSALLYVKGEAPIDEPEPEAPPPPPPEDDEHGDDEPLGG